MRRISTFRTQVDRRRPQDRLPARGPTGRPQGPAAAARPGTWARRIDANAEKLIGVVALAAVALASVTGQPLWLALIPLAAIVLYA